MHATITARVNGSFKADVFDIAEHCCRGAIALSDVSAYITVALTKYLETSGIVGVCVDCNQTVTALSDIEHSAVLNDHALEIVIKHKGCSAAERRPRKGVPL